MVAAFCACFALGPSGDAPGGIHDLEGNVVEWTSTPPTESGDRITRGGAWAATDVAGMRSAARSSRAPSYASTRVGFRCAR
jgi:formylglycine-generating enzyme required for sulfatase activity